MHYFQILEEVSPTPGSRAFRFRMIESYPTSDGQRTRVIGMRWKTLAAAEAAMREAEERIKRDCV